MTKLHGKCAICGATKFLNFTKLCRSCNRSSAGIKIKELALAKKFEVGKNKAKDAAFEAEIEAQEEAAAEAEAKETADAEKKE